MEYGYMKYYYTPNMLVSATLILEDDKAVPFCLPADELISIVNRSKFCSIPHEKILEENLDSTLHSVVFYYSDGRAFPLCSIGTNVSFKDPLTLGELIWKISEGKRYREEERAKGNPCDIQTILKNIEKYWD